MVAQAFPFATKLRTAARRGAVVVVNLSEGEPASRKDEVLATRRPHLILDGAVLAARALGARRVHLVLPGDKPMVRIRMTEALAEREGADKVEWRIDTADAGIRQWPGPCRDRTDVGACEPPGDRLGAGGRVGLSRTSDTAVERRDLRPARQHLGPRSRPGDDAHHARRRHPGSEGRRGGHRCVVGDGAEPDGARPPCAAGWLPRSLGPGRGAQGSPHRCRGSRGSRCPPGCGVVLPLPAGSCPVHETARIVSYLAGQSAGRCGPCKFGLPALALAVDAADRGDGPVERILELTGVLERTWRLCASRWHGAPGRIAAALVRRRVGVPPTRGV